MDIEVMVEAYETQIKTLKAQLKQAVEALATVSQERDILKSKAESCDCAKKPTRKGKAKK